MRRLSLEHVSVPGLLRDVTVNINDGELVCVWAERRVARLALLNIAAGVMRPGSGITRANGRLVFAQREWPAAGGREVLPQVMVPLLASRRSVTVARSAALSVLLEWDAEDWAGRLLADLEDHELARVALIRALAAEPEILLVDDPTFGLEPIYADGILDLLRVARDRGAAVLVTTPTGDIMRDADILCTLTQGVLRGGRANDADVIMLDRRRGTL